MLSKKYSFTVYFCKYIYIFLNYYYVFIKKL
jgi:hypothetical protein